jgi:hypothetical protein
MTLSQDELIPYFVIEAVLKRLEIAGPLLQDTGSLCRAVRQGIATEMEDLRLEDIRLSEREALRSRVARASEGVLRPKRAKIL